MQDPRNDVFLEAQRLSGVVPVENPFQGRADGRAVRSQPVEAGFSMVSARFTQSIQSGVDRHFAKLRKKYPNLRAKQGGLIDHLSFTLEHGVEANLSPKFKCHALAREN